MQAIYLYKAYLQSCIQYLIYRLNVQILKQEQYIFEFVKQL